MPALSRQKAGGSLGVTGQLELHSKTLFSHEQRNKETNQQINVLRNKIVIRRKISEKTL